MSHTTLRVRSIACVTGNQMDVNVEDALPRGGTHVHADVVAVGTKFFINFFSLGSCQFHAGSDLLGSEIKEAGAMPERNDQGVPRANGVAVARAVRQFVTPRHPAWCAEKARVVRITHL